MNEDDSHHQLPYSDYFKANIFIFWANVSFFHQYILEVGEGCN